MSDVIRTSLRGPDLGRKLAANRTARRPWKVGAIPKPYTPRPVEAGPRMPRGAPASRSAGDSTACPAVSAVGCGTANPDGCTDRGAGADRALLHLMIQKQRYNPVVSNALRYANSALPGQERVDIASADIVRRLRKHPELLRKARAIAGCSTTWLVAVPKGSSGVNSRPVPANQCRERLCPRCQRVRASKWAERVRPLLEKLEAGGEFLNFKTGELEKRGPSPAKFLTLTQVSKPGESLRAALRRFNEHFRALYLHEEWKSRVRGYVAAREVTWTKKKCWHFHVHVLADFDYWPQREISALWHSITGDSYIVDVRAVKRGSEREAIKYPIKFIGVPPSKVVELVQSTAGVRMISIGGEWRKFLRVADMEPEDCPEGHELVPASVLYARAQAGCVRSTEAINSVLDWALARGAHAHRAVLMALMRPHDALHDPSNFDLLRKYQTLGLEPLPRLHVETSISLETAGAA